MKQEDIKRFNDIAKKIPDKVKRGDYAYDGLCQAHGDARRSLGIKLCENGTILLNCFAGCNVSKICDSLGIKIADLYPTAQIIAIFDFINLDHELLYQEIKYDETALSRFKVRRPGKKKGEWIWDVKGIPLILYNLFDVANAGKDDIIFMCEGCKDGRTLKYQSLVATAALWNDWDNTDTSLLDGRRVVILVDNDDGGETKALIAAHDRYGKSKSIKLLRLPKLKPGGDVTDWLEANNKIEKLLELARSDDLKEWYPLESIRQRIKDGLLTGLSFEHYDPRPSWDSWYDVFNPPEEGLLWFYDGEYLKGNMELLLYDIESENSIIESLTQYFALCFNKKSPKGQDLFKPTPSLVDMILKSGRTKIDLNVIKNPKMPIFNPFFKDQKLEHYESDDIILLKSTNFYIPERVCFPRNMELCIAKSALPFDYDEKARCPEIQKALDVQWNTDIDAINMLLQFLYYYMLHTFKYKALLNMIGESDSGKTQILELIRHFIGVKNCRAISLGKIGKQFELYPVRDAKLLISDDTNLTKRDLQEGAIKENIKSIVSGAIIRMEKKNGDIISRQIAGQMLLAGNKPLTISEFSSALSNRFKFLDFPHVFLRGKDMNTDILATWLPELSGLLNLALDAGPKLIEQDGFIEPKSSAKARAIFEGGANPVKKWIIREFDINSINDPIKWNTRIEDLKTYYRQDCEEEGEDMLSPSKFNIAVESISGITKDCITVKIIDAKSGETKYKRVRCWIGLRKKGTSGVITAENVNKSDEF